MASEKLSQLDASTSLAGSDLLYVVEGGVSKSATKDLLLIDTATSDELNTTNHNLVLTNWQMQNQLNLTQLPQKDGFVDYFVDETHTDTGNTTLEYDAAGDLYANPSSIVAGGYDFNLTIDQPNGTSTFTDASQNALTATGYGGVDFETDGSAYDGASTSIVLDGSTQYIATADSANFDLGANSDIILEVAFNPDSVTGSQTLLSRWEFSGSKNSIALNLSGADVNLLFSTDGSDSTSYTLESGGISTGQWYNLLVIYDRVAGNIRYFKNGALISDTASSLEPYSTDTGWSIGARRTGTGDNADNYFDGKIGLARIASGEKRYLGILDTDDTAKGEDFVLDTTGNADTSTTFTDLSTNASTITPQGGIAWANDASPYSNDHATSALFDGSDDVLEVDSTFFDETADITVDSVIDFDSSSVSAQPDAEADLGLMSGAGHGAGGSDYITVTNSSGTTLVPSATGVNFVAGPRDELPALNYAGTDMRTYEGTIGFDETEFIDIQGNVDFSISFWCKIATNSGEKGSVISYSKYGNTWDDQIFTIRITNDTISLIAAATGSSATSFASTSGFIDAGNWMHVTLVKSGTSISFYKNHVLFDSGTLSNGATIHTGDGTDRWRIGFNPQNDNNRTFVGELAGFKGYDYALTSPQIINIGNNDFKYLASQDDFVTNRSWNISLSPDLYSAYLVRTTDGTSNTVDRIPLLGIGLSADEWTHSRFTFEQSTGEFKGYVNEIELASATGPVLSMFSTSTAIEIGGRSGNNNYLDGKISGFKITNAIVASTMISDYESLKGPSPSFSDPYDDLSATPADINGNYVSLTEVADETPTEIRLLCLIETDGTLNTDVIGEVSRDGGTTWTAVTLEYTVAFEGSVSCVASDPVNVSGQPSGTNVVGRIRSINDAVTDVHGFSMGW